LAARQSCAVGSGAKIIWLYKILRKSCHQNHYKLWSKFYLRQNLFGSYTNAANARRIVIGLKLSF